MSIIQYVKEDLFKRKTVVTTEKRVPWLNSQYTVSSLWSKEGREEKALFLVGRVVMCVETFVHASRDLDALVSFWDEGIHSNCPQYFWGRAKCEDVAQLVDEIEELTYVGSGECFEVEEDDWRTRKSKS